VTHHILQRSPVGRPHAIIPLVAFTDPALAQVGMSESEARADRRAVQVVRIPFAGNERAEIEHDPHGAMKVIASARGDRILGASIVGRRAAELIAPFALAISSGLGLGALSAFAPSYPSLSELTPRLATGTQGGASPLGGVRGVRSLTEEWLRRIIGVTGNLG
jgi:pyruvate/2-oxoglutarate dehydrogenase complex dihydrolipoamide dehydrogenase (E3) component